MARLTAAQVRTVRASFVAKQGGRCALCQGAFTAKAPNDPVLDHNHGTGAVRAVLHRGCNALLGKVENNAARYGVRNIAAFANGIAAYLLAHMTNITGYTHPTHKTPEEKRVRRNTKARIARVKRKELV